MVTLTQEQIDSLGLSPDVINELATANPLTRKSLMRKIISKFKDSLVDEARLTDDPVKREKLQNLIDETVKAARKAIKDAVKEGGADARSAASGFNKLLKPLTDLNIYADGQRLDEQYLYNTEITEDIEIRNPKTELLTDDKFKKYIPEYNKRRISADWTRFIATNDIKEREDIAFKIAADLGTQTYKDKAIADLESVLGTSWTTLLEELCGIRELNNGIISIS